MNDNTAALALDRGARIPAPPAVAALALIVLGFAGLLSVRVHALDIRMLLALRQPAVHARPPWLQDMLRDFVGLSGVGVLLLFIAGGLGLLWWSGRRRDARWFAGGVVGASLIASAMKHLIARPRPELVPHAAYTFTASFPSGNTMMATVVWLLLAFALADAAGQRAVRNIAVAAALVIALLVGAGRVCLGVHWPSDVVEAWGLGIAWVWLLRAASAMRMRPRRSQAQRILQRLLNGPT